MENKRYLGIDYGRRRVGLAVSDVGGIIARPLETVKVTGPDQAAEAVGRVAAEHDVVGIVIGLPLNLSGDPSPLSEEAQRFGRLLEARSRVPIHYEDERLSSRQAEYILHAHGKKIKGNKEIIDRMAAAIILQSFLDRLNLAANGSGHERR